MAGSPHECPLQSIRKDFCTPFCTPTALSNLEEIDTAVEYERTGGHNACWRFNDRVQRWRRLRETIRPMPISNIYAAIPAKRDWAFKAKQPLRVAIPAVQTIRDRP